MADKYAFLSDEWFDAADKLIAEHSTGGPPAPQPRDEPRGHRRRQRGPYVPHGRRGRRDAVRRRVTPTAPTSRSSTDIETAREVFVANNPAGRDAGVHGRQGAHAGRHDQADDGAGRRPGGNTQLTEALQSITE